LLWLPTTNTNNQQPELESMATIQMYTTASCGYCVAAKSLLARKGYTEIEEIRVDLSPERRAEMIERTRQRTVPQIFINGQHVGGHDDMVALNRAGKLDPLLAGVAP
jgi:glutaredoxin 3